MDDKDLATMQITIPIRRVRLSSGFVTGAEEAFRRAFDILVAALALFLTFPLLVMIAIAIQLDSPGPAIFRQLRVGQGGKLFTFYKFRGMYVDARERWPELYRYEYGAEEIRLLHFHPQADPRVTRVGRYIRHTSLDELLNFWNVLKGDMNLVGPRPEIPEMIRYYEDAAQIVLSVKPGVTSLAKANGRDGLTFSETLSLDIKYIKERSLLLDLKIIAMTVVKVLFRQDVLPG